MGLAVVDLVRKHDLQNRNTDPVALIIGDRDVASIAPQHDYRRFTHPADFKPYVRHKVLSLVPIDEQLEENLSLMKNSSTTKSVLS